MKALAFLGFVACAACSHDEKPAQTTPDVGTSEPATSATATATAAATAEPADTGGHSACDAVRCRGGMVCKMVSGTPTCVAKE